MVSKERMNQMRMTDACNIRHAVESASRTLRAMRAQAIRAGNDPKTAHNLIQKGLKNLNDLAFGMDVPGNSRPIPLLEIIFGSDKQFLRLLSTQKTNPSWVSQVSHLVRLGVVNLEQFQEMLDASIADIEKRDSIQRRLIMEVIEMKTGKNVRSTPNLDLVARTISHHKTFE